MWWLIGGFVALAVLCGGAVAVVAWQVTQKSALPDGWPTASFAMDAATDDKSREDMGLVLADRLTRYGVSNARLDVRDQGVVIAVPPGKETALDELRREMPLRVAMSFRQVIEQQPVPAGDCKAVDGKVCSSDGRILYRIADPLLGGTEVRDAVVDHDQAAGGWRITVSFTEQGQQAFTAATQENVGKQLAIMVMDVIVTAPQIASVITGDAQIVGGFSQPAAKAIAAAIRLSRQPGDIRTSA